MTPTLQDFQKWYEKHFKQIQEDYFTFLRFPSISTDPAYKKDVRDAAVWVKNSLQRIGFQTEVWETSFNPVVFGSYVGNPSKPTVLIYHHYDVQPVDPLEKWHSPPFEPVLKDGKVYARGASDNKGQCFNTLTALKAFFELAKKVDYNIKVFVEGEEECGSRGAFEVLQTKKEALKADYLLIVDMGLPAENTPSITLGLRGITSLEVTVRNSKIDLHSGIHGGIVLNPNRALVEMLSKLWDEKGKVAIPGFYDDVALPKKSELEVIDQVVDENYLQQQFGVKAFRGEGGYSLWESNAIRPTLEINGIAGGYAGPGFKTVIPSMAIAKISCRIVPNQDPIKVTEAIANYLKKIAPKGLEVNASLDHGGKPIRSSPDTHIAKICSQAYTEVFGKPCRNILCGASVPLVADLQKAVGGEVAMIGVGLDSDDIHAPNEHFSLQQLEQGFLTMGRILSKL